MIRHKHMSRTRKQELLLEELCNLGLATVDPIAFADEARTQHVYQAWLAAVKANHASSVRWPLREWPGAARLVKSLIRRLPAGPLFIIHDHANEVGALVVEDRDLVDKVLESWPLKRVDFAATGETGGSGVHVEYNFEAHSSTEFYPDGSIELIVWENQNEE